MPTIRKRIATRRKNETDFLCPEVILDKEKNYYLLGPTKTILANGLLVLLVAIG
jgi:hypothetical protein